MKNAIVLCSGGLDSVVTAHYVRNRLKYENIVILFFDYNQRALKQERKFSELCAKKINASFLEIKVKDIGKISQSLINKNGKIIEVKNLNDTRKESEKWYVECRNLIFLSYALALADSLFVSKKQKSEIFVGFKCEGRDCYPDATPEFLSSFNALSKISSKSGTRVIAPLIKLDKEDVILLGKKLGVNFKETYSCYIGNEKPCGKCLACELRKAGFYWAGIDES